MKILQIEQGSDEWKNWRRSILTASDSSSIIDCNPYCDAMELRFKKLGLLPETVMSKAMQRGHEMEPIARDYFNKINNLEFAPAVVESSEYPFLGASLDGLTDDHKYILEIKCGVKSHEMAKDSKIPDYYYTQIQQQLICTRAKKCFYFSYQSNDDHVTIDVFPDADFEAYYIPLAEKFWMDLIFKEPEIFKEKKSK